MALKKIVEYNSQLAWSKNSSKNSDKVLTEKYVPLKFHMVINQPIFGATNLCNFSLQTLHKPNLAYVMLVYLCTVKKCEQIIISTRTVTFLHDVKNL